MTANVSYAHLWTDGMRGGHRTLIGARVACPARPSPCTWSAIMRAEQVTEPNLANTAVQVADAASKFVAKLPRMRDESQNHAPGAPAPPVMFEMTILNQHITEGLKQLADACQD